MAKKTIEPELPAFGPPPLFFADQPAALLLGPHISRISFGVEDLDDGDFPRPVVEVAMPTVSLLRFANDLKKALDQADFRKHAVVQLEQAAKEIASGGDTSPRPRKVAVQKDSKGTRRITQD